jgi:hypothetical protein
MSIIYRKDYSTLMPDKFTPIVSGNLKDKSSLYDTSFTVYFLPGGLKNLPFFSPPAWVFCSDLRRSLVSDQRRKALRTDDSYQNSKPLIINPITCCECLTGASLPIG